ncbi:cdc42 effector protein 1-like [Scleropages formosus]|uniref:Cdc42 effector protein 1-like n=1 Tax=Scleropages formosus TaxID=113540 RepID=A0A0P7V2Q6_SCLFO|nr:cdc42 effector protein 1-like [Scleropages formosus]
MNLGKLSGIKGLVSNSHGKRRFRGELTADMISPPLGDFRHTMHVGRGGDVFGDTSFLSNHGGTGDADSTPEKGPGFFSRTLRHVRKAPPLSGVDSSELSPPPPAISPIIKNAISLPRLDVDPPNGCPKRTLFPNSPSCPETSTYSYGVESGFATLPRLSRSERQLQDASDFGSAELHHDLPHEQDFDYLVRADSMTSFTVDLGPSLMSEVLGLIDGSASCRDTTHMWNEEGEEEGMGTRSPALHSTPASAAAVNGNVNGRMTLDPWGEQESGNVFKTAVPDAAKSSPARVEPGMEAERFQRAADMLARHYGGGVPLKDERHTNGRGPLQHLGPINSCTQSTQRRAPCSYPEEEDEIKV